MTVDRRSALCDQTRLTGIDVVAVVDPGAQTTLRVLFAVDPSALDDPMVDPALLGPPPAGDDAGPPVPPADPPGLHARIVSSATGRAVVVTALAWRRVRTAAGERVALEVTTAAPGDASPHRLWVDDPRVDPFSNGAVFSFRQGCESDLDCRGSCRCAQDEVVDTDVDYLARDFASYRRALLDLAARRYPAWSEPLEADLAVMLLEVLAALGDEFAYAQDRIARETALPTATQRRSRTALARLVDYQPDPGTAARADLAVWVAAPGTGAWVPEGATVWARPESRPAVPFTVEPPEGPLGWHHAAWNELPLHRPDADVPCLPAGSTEAWLVTTSPTAAELPPGATGTPEEQWQGRRAVLRSRPADPAEPERAHPVTLLSVEHTVDELVRTDADAPTPLARVTWREPTPWPLPLAETTALLNVVPALAGAEVVERFRVGPDAAVTVRHPGLTGTDLAAVLALPRAVEREGPGDDRGVRGRVLRYGLRAAESAGLGWHGPRDPLGIGTASRQQPLLELTEVAPPAFTPVPGAAWGFTRDLLGVDLDTTAFTLEEGTWRDLLVHRTPRGDVTHADYASDAGWTVRFGDGAFGRPPEDGTLIEVRYRTGPGTGANLPPDTVTHLTLPAATVPTLAYAAAVTNPLAVTTGTDEEPPERVRLDAPEAFRARPLRAVRPEDYSEIAQRIAWVQRARSTTRWTGSWSTDVVAADTLGGSVPDAEQRAHLSDVVDCVRQAARDARVADPDHLDIDLDVRVCVSPDAYPGEVAPRVAQALAPPGLLDPDNLSFGQPLRRSAVEAAVQAVPGVVGVDELLLRVRRRRDWAPFPEPELVVGPAQIVRLSADPLHPDRGSVRVRAHRGSG